MHISEFNPSTGGSPAPRVIRLLYVRGDWFAYAESARLVLQLCPGVQPVEATGSRTDPPVPAVCLDDASLLFLLKMFQAQVSDGSIYIPLDAPAAAEAGSSRKE